jgi:cobalt-zinc-cadmium efflux system outer membrane protein
MTGVRGGRLVVLAVLTVATGQAEKASAQAPVIEQSGQISSGISSTTPGSNQSLLGPMPGAGGTIPGLQPGRDELLFGRMGPSAPHVPTSVTTPGGTYQGPRTTRGIAAPQPLPAPKPPFYGRLEMPSGPEDDGPPDGLTLDRSMELYVHQNLELQAQYLEIPQARADVLTASLRANPIFYADTQLIPYGSFSTRRPSGPTQYDVNISHPIDFSHKRHARTIYAEVVLRVTENQYQDVVRLGLNNLYLNYVDVLAARQTVRYAQVTVEGLDKLLSALEALHKESTTFSADVDQASSERKIAAIGLMDAEENLLRQKRILAELLNIPPDQAEGLEVRGTIEDSGPPPPPDRDLIHVALDGRADVAAYRLGVETAKASLNLAMANRFADAYLLYQPFTYQNNAPYGKDGLPSWALGITVPLPIYNRNQGNIERAKINVRQSEIQLGSLERRVITQVQQAANEYRNSGRIVRAIRAQVEPALKRAVEARTRLFQEGEVTIFTFLDAQRRYNDNVKAYLDSAVRHRKAMLELNTAVGQRILP